MDVAALVLRHPEYRDRAQALATAYRVKDRLRLWLEDRRLQREMEEQGKGERALARQVRTATKSPRAKRRPRQG